MSLVSLKAELRQQLKLSPQLLQSMEILQMNSQELLEYLGRLTEENPLLEQEDAPSLRDAYEELRQKASWIDGGVYGATGTRWGEGACQTPCWPCPSTLRKWWMRTATWTMPTWTACGS